MALEFSICPYCGHSQENSTVLSQYHCEACGSVVSKTESKPDAHTVYKTPYDKAAMVVDLRKKISSVVEGALTDARGINYRSKKVHGRYEIQRPCTPCEIRDIKELIKGIDLSGLRVDDLVEIEAGCVENESSGIYELLVSFRVVIDESYFKRPQVERERHDESGDCFGWFLKALVVILVIACFSLSFYLFPGVGGFIGGLIFAGAIFLFVVKVGF